MNAESFSSFFFPYQRENDPGGFFHSATSLIIHRTAAPAETQTERIKSELLRLALCWLLFDLPLRGDVSAERKMDLFLLSVLHLSLDILYALIYSLHVAHPTPSQTSDHLTVHTKTDDLQNSCLELNPKTLVLRGKVLDLCS